MKRMGAWSLKEKKREEERDKEAFRGRLGRERRSLRGKVEARVEGNGKRSE